VRTFVTFRHRALPQRQDVPPRGDPFRIGRLSAELASKVLGGVGGGDHCRVTECAGLLIYAMDGYGLCYEEVCQLSCHKVAEILRQITGDNRLTDPRRHLELRSQIGQAEALVQVVKLAEILTALAEIPQSYDAATRAARAQDLKTWADRTAHLVDAMRALHGTARMRPYLEKARRELEQLAQGGRTPGRSRHEQAGPRTLPGPGAEDRAPVAAVG
jgi:hypothetical protein